MEVAIDLHGEDLGEGRELPVHGVDLRAPGEVIDLGQPEAGDEKDGEGGEDALPQRLDEFA